MAMAMEAVRQIMWLTAGPEDVSNLESRNYHYTLKDLRFLRGLILEDGVDVPLMLSMAPIAKMGSGWWEYKIMSRMASESSSAPSSTAPGQWHENSQGLIRLVLDKDAPLPSMPRHAGSLPLKYPSAGRLWYKAMADVGQIWGPDFQQVLSVECTEGQLSSRSIVSLVPPSSKWEPQSEYPLHPACMDGLVQAVSLASPRKLQQRRRRAASSKHRSPYRVGPDIELKRGTFYQHKRTSVCGHSR